MKMPKVVLIEWIDSVGTAGVDVWTDVADVKEFKLCTCLSIGWLFTEAPDYVVIAPHIGQERDGSLEDNQVSGVMLIPRCAIKSMKTVNVAMPAPGWGGKQIPAKKVASRKKKKS